MHDRFIPTGTAPALKWLVRPVFEEVTAGQVRTHVQAVSATASSGTQPSGAARRGGAGKELTMRAEEGDESIAELADYAEQAEQNLDESIAPLEGKRVAILATNGVERRELQEPRDAVQAAGASTELISLQEGTIDMRDNDLNPGGTEAVERLVGDITPEDFDALLIPGGTVNADKLRADDKAVKFVHDFVESGKPVGVICHGPWTLIDAGVAKGRTLTSYPSLRIDLQNAGATVVDREVVIDGNLISSRGPDDLPAFSSAVVDALAGT